MERYNGRRRRIRVPAARELLAVTTTSIVFPASVDASLYELPVAPEILEQFVPDALQSATDTRSRSDRRPRPVRRAQRIPNHRLTTNRRQRRIHRRLHRNRHHGRRRRLA